LLSVAFSAVGLGLNTGLAVFSTGFSMFSGVVLFVSPPRSRIVGGRFRHLGFYSFFYFFRPYGADARLDGSSRALNLPHFLCRHFGFSFRIHSFCGGLSVTIPVGRVSISGSALSAASISSWVAEASIQVQPSAASHSALVHLGAGRGIWRWRRRPFRHRSSVSLSALRLMLLLLLLLSCFCCYSCFCFFLVLLIVLLLLGLLLLVKCFFDNFAVPR
jgi:hypothetical protein